MAGVCFLCVFLVWFGFCCCFGGSCFILVVRTETAVAFLLLINAVRFLHTVTVSVILVTNQTIGRIGKAAGDR